jgi:hypothetical protein
MPDAAPALPKDVAGLKAMVLAQSAELAEIRALRQAQEASSRRREPDSSSSAPR